MTTTSINYIIKAAVSNTNLMALYAFLQYRSPKVCHPEAAIQKYLHTERENPNTINLTANTWFNFQSFAPRKLTSLPKSSFTIAINFGNLI